nr:protein transporter SEC24 [Cryptococcus depauperatus CBS 7855]
MPPRSRYAVDPSLSGKTSSPVPSSYPQQMAQQQSDYFQPTTAGFWGQSQGYQQNVDHVANDMPQLHNVLEREPTPIGPYAPVAPTYSSIHPQSQPQPVEQQHWHPSLAPPPNAIPQPPHHTGGKLDGDRFKVRIDPGQVPNPIEPQEMDQNRYDEEDFLSCTTHGLIPQVQTDYRGVDQGNSLPRFIRTTLSCVPSNGQLLDTTALPFALLVQPLAPLRYDEAPVPCGNEDGPPRCDKCRGYINVWSNFIDGGRKWMCNLCRGINLVSPQYFCHLGPNGQRLDHMSRPELQHGTVDFPVPSSYWALQPPSGSLFENIDSDVLTSTAQDLLGGLQASLGQSQGPHIPSAKEQIDKEKQKQKERKRHRQPTSLSRIFVLDVSVSGGEKGVVREVCEGIRRAIYGVKERSQEEQSEQEEIVMGDGQKVGFVSVGEAVSFWNLAPYLQAPMQAVVSDLEEMFIPFAKDFLVDPQESRMQIETLLDLLPNLAEQGKEGMRVAMGSAVVGALAGLSHTGGQINLFLTSFSSHGAGALTTRENPDYYNTDKEKTLFTPASWYISTAEKLAEAGVGVNVFLFPDAYIDLASVGALAAGTGGDTFFHPRFNTVRDKVTIHDEIRAVLTRDTVYNATTKVRCSAGLRVSDYLGNFYQRSLTDLEFPIMSQATSFTAVLKHEGRMDEKQPAFVQVATLYTTQEGERRVRVLNMSFVVSSLIGNVFRFTDLEACVSVLLKAGLSQVTQRSLRDIRKSLTERCNRILLMYRKYCASAVQPRQLVLPESMKLLPLYTLGMLKCKALKGNPVTSDVRMYYTRLIKSLSPTRLIMLLYPRLLAIHDLHSTAGFPNEKGKLVLPQFTRDSHAWMVAEGAYLLINGEVGMIWFGHGVSPQIVMDLYGVENLDELDLRITRLPKLPTILSTQVRNILTHLSSPTFADHELPVIIVRQNMDGSEVEFADQLVEDSNNDALSYTDYLMTSHRQITSELSGAKSESWMPW